MNERVVVGSIPLLYLLCWFLIRNVEFFGIYGSYGGLKVARMVMMDIFRVHWGFCTIRMCIYIFLNSLVPFLMALIGRSHDGIRYVKSSPRSQYKYILSRTFGLRGRGWKYSTSGSVYEQRGLCRRKNDNGK